MKAAAREDGSCCAPTADPERGLEIRTGPADRGADRSLRRLTISARLGMCNTSRNDEDQDRREEREVHGRDYLLRQARRRIRQQLACVTAREIERVCEGVDAEPADAAHVRTSRGAHYARSSWMLKDDTCEQKVNLPADQHIPIRDLIRRGRRQSICPSADSDIVAHVVPTRVESRRRGEADSVYTPAKRRPLEDGADARKWRRRKRAVPQNEAGAPENRIVVLRTCPDAPSRNLHPVLGPVVTARPGTLPFSSGSDTYGTLKGCVVHVACPRLDELCTISAQLFAEHQVTTGSHLELPARRTRESKHLHYAVNRRVAGSNPA
jgi:hypothetical protein